MTAGNDFFCCALRNFTQLIGTGDTDMECNMRSLNTKLVFTALGILTMFASPAFAQESHHHRHASLTPVPVGQSGRAVYNMVITPDPSQRGNIYNMVINPVDDPALTGGGSVGYNELEREDNSGGD
jgi:hypothetical protein